MSGRSPPHAASPQHTHAAHAAAATLWHSHATTAAAAHAATSHARHAASASSRSPARRSGEGLIGTLETLQQGEAAMHRCLPPALRELLPKVNPLTHDTRVLVGATPREDTDADSVPKLLALIRALRVRTFVCLQPDAELDAYGAHYAELARHVAAEHGLDAAALEFVAFPIADLRVADDAAVAAFVVDALLPRVLAASTDARLYLHCRGGNGRTGTIASLALGALYGLPAALAMAKVGHYHDTMRRLPRFASPETLHQRQQVERLMPSVWRRAQVALLRAPDADAAQSDAGRPDGATGSPT